MRITDKWAKCSQGDRQRKKQCKGWWTCIVTKSQYKSTNSPESNGEQMFKNSTHWWNQLQTLDSSLKSLKSMTLGDNQLNWLDELVEINHEPTCTSLRRGVGLFFIYFKNAAIQKKCYNHMVAFVTLPYRAISHLLMSQVILVTPWEYTGFPPVGLL